MYYIYIINSSLDHQQIKQYHLKQCAIEQIFNDLQCAIDNTFILKLILSELMFDCFNDYNIFEQICDIVYDNLINLINNNLLYQQQKCIIFIDIIQEILQKFDPYDYFKKKMCRKLIIFMQCLQQKISHHQQIQHCIMEILVDGDEILLDGEDGDEILVDGDAILQNIQHQLNHDCCNINWKYVNKLVNYKNSAYWINTIDYLSSSIQDRIRDLYMFDTGLKPCKSMSTTKVKTELHLALTVIYALDDMFKNYPLQETPTFQNLITSFDVYHLKEIYIDSPTN